MRLEEKFGTRLLALRIATGLTQAELAERVELVPASISNIERGGNGPAFGRLETFAEALELARRHPGAYRHLHDRRNRHCLDVLAGFIYTCRSLYQSALGGLCTICRQGNRKLCSRLRGENCASTPYCRFTSGET